MPSDVSVHLVAPVTDADATGFAAVEAAAAAITAARARELFGMRDRCHHCSGRGLLGAIFCWWQTIEEDSTIGHRIGGERCRR